MFTDAIWEPGSEPVSAHPEQLRRWDEVIFDRHSTRTFDGTPLTRAEVAALAGLQPEPLGGARVRHVLIEGDTAVNAIFKGLVGGYGRIIGAPALVAFVARTADAGHQAALGYVGEQVVLEAVSLGLATCWVAGSFRRAVVGEYTDLAAGEEVLCVSPVGRGAQTTGLRRLHDASMKWFVPGRGQRKPLEQLVDGTPTEPWLQAALEAARWAPSSVNRQPWRFVLEPDGRVAIGHAGEAEDSRSLDCGIAMANFAVAARARGVSGRWTPV